ncbi:phosphatase PAP2 family protein [Lachnobacterium bovis]|uniref:PAP2 superfamily protein n=1 Tax=Lachnobacterium bovis TaxID=140626 RepID=A0A1H9U401_9FIRM|nr:phosphatase PAP2 family protein [Lachnobacterium bovis]SES04290.1 PAP2 superfamily protein [Lachnobacterium bovis]
MKRDTYIKMIDFFNANSVRAKTIQVVNKLITRVVFVSYPCFLAYLLWKKDKLFLKGIMVPLISFVILTLIRKMINAPRPYEVFQTEAVIKKETKGKSFPSRHVFSIFIIASTYYFVLDIKTIGIVVAISGCVLATTRVLLGVHFTRDVIAGAMCGILAGVIGFVIF